MARTLSMGLKNLTNLATTGDNVGPLGSFRVLPSPPPPPRRAIIIFNRRYYTRGREFFRRVCTACFRVSATLYDRGNGWQFRQARPGLGEGGERGGTCSFIREQLTGLRVANLHSSPLPPIDTEFPGRRKNSNRPSACLSPVTTSFP